MSYKLNFELLKLPPSLNVFMRWHYRKRAAEFKKIEQSCYAQIKRPKVPLDNYKIKFTRYTNRPLDIDNLVASFKPILDALVRSGVITDDKWCSTDNLRYRQIKVSKKTQQKVAIKVKGLPSKEQNKTED
jgi:Holliday junction resolvase RusA-like endonuclease